MSTEEDEKKLERVMSYLNGSRDKGIVFKSTGEIVVRAYIDASHAVHADAKGHTGVLITLGLGPVMTKSVKQKILAKSSTESELVALSDYADEVNSVREFLSSVGIKTAPAVIYQDNKSTLALIRQGELGGKDRKRHFKVRRLMVRELCSEGCVRVRYIPTTAMMADMLTNPLQGELFTRLRSASMNCHAVKTRHIQGGVSDDTV